MTSLLLVVVRSDSTEQVCARHLAINSQYVYGFTFVYMLITFVLSLFKIAIYKYFGVFIRQTGLP